MLTLHNLAFERNQQFLFSHLNEVLQAGELLQIRGANGTGKSTLLRILTGLLEPHNGTIFWKKQPIAQQNQFYQQQLQYIGHQNGLKSYLTVNENLKLQSVLAAKKPNRQQMSTVLEKMNLKQAQHTQAIHLSSGQLRRLSLARLLINPAPLWILDEPATALDFNGQQLLTDLLKNHLVHGGMAILATHQDLSLAGKIIQLGDAHV